MLDTGFRRYEDYITHGDKHDVLEHHLVDRLPQLFAGRERIRMLDIGAGTGRLTWQVSRLFGQAGIQVEIVALEPCRRAKQRFLDSHGDLANQVTLQERAFSIGAPLDRPPYDLIMASHVCYYFEDKGAFVQRVMNSLAEGGHALFVGTSISILQNDLYRTILPRLRTRPDLSRTFDSDGRMDFAEEIECSLFDQNIVFRRDVLPSHIAFSLAEISLDLEAIEAGNAEGGPVLKALSFLWRFSVTSLLAERDAWRALFRQQMRLGQPLSLNYEDIVLTAAKLPIPNQPNQ